MRHPHSSRRAFTLLELLVVVSIIAILAALSTTAVLKVLSNAKIQATQATLRSIHQALQLRIDAYQRATDTTDKLKGVENVNSHLSEACGNWALAEVLARKAAFRKYFPQTWAEAATLLAQQPDVTPPSAPNSATESGEVLYFMLARSAVLGYSPEGNDFFTGTSHVQDTDNNGFPEFIDAWGRPLRFYRWPTRLLIPGGTYTSAGVQTADWELTRILVDGLPTSIPDCNLDPDDPHNLTLSPSCSSLVSSFPTNYHTPRVWHAPLVVSAGPDEDTGLFEPSDTANGGNLARQDSDPDHHRLDKIWDNITNLNIKSGGK